METEWGLFNDTGDNLVAEDGSTFLVSETFDLTAEDGSTLLTNATSDQLVNFTIVTAAYTMTAAQGSYTLTGNAASLNWAATDSLLAEGTLEALTNASGDFIIADLSTVDGALTDETVTYTLTDQAGVYILIGEAVTVPSTYTLYPETGYFTLTGNAAGLFASRFIADLTTATYTFNDQSANLVATHPDLVATQASFTMTGFPATLQYSGAAVSMAAPAGFYTVTGSDARLLAGYRLTADTASFTVTGNDATLTANANVLTAETTSFAFTAYDVAFRHFRLTAETAYFEFTASNTPFPVERIRDNSKTGGDDAPMPWEENYRKKRWDAEKADRERLRAMLEGRDPDEETAGSAPAVEDEPAAAGSPSPPAPRPARPPLDINLEAFQAELAQRMAQRQAQLLAQRNVIAAQLVLF
ncbi:MAG TPA: hypothetical protein PLF26_13080 [Blastocatellia bacterium]|nr:hypothetical protein [Blastocatellia bacterium]